MTMPTAKKRINVTIDDETYKVLEKLSEKRAKSISSVSLNLIEQALELQEDLHFSRIADERLIKREKRISHRKVWE
jgi:predicted DNA-binding protein